MAFNYAITAATAQRLLDRFGQVVIFKAKEPGVYNPTTGKTEYGYLGEQWTEHEVTTVTLQYDLAVVDGTSVRMTDLRLLVSPLLPQEPKQGDVFVMPVLEGGELKGYEEYEVVTCLTYAPGGVVVLYEVQARKD